MGIYEDYKYAKERDEAWEEEHHYFELSTNWHEVFNTGFVRAADMLDERLKKAEANAEYWRLLAERHNVKLSTVERRKEEL